MKIDIDKVSSLIRETAELEVMPRYQALAHHEVRHKEKGDPVTVADEASEARLTAALTDLLPGSLVVGEEAAEADPSVFGRLGEDAPVWIIDPIDGTRNFAKGQPVFAVMVALVQKGKTVAAWILELPNERMAVAESGGGAWLDGARVSAAAMPASLAEARGTLHASTWGRPEIARSLERNRGKIDQLKSLGCAGAEYLRLASGEMHFSLFTKLMPWDHAPGTLLYEEAGGLARLLEGDNYSPLLRETQGLLMAPGEEAWEVLRQALFD